MVGPISERTENRSGNISWYAKPLLHLPFAPENFNVPRVWDDFQTYIKQVQGAVAAAEERAAKASKEKKKEGTVENESDFQTALAKKDEQIAHLKKAAQKEFLSLLVGQDSADTPDWLAAARKGMEAAKAKAKQQAKPSGPQGGGGATRPEKEKTGKAAEEKRERGKKKKKSKSGRNT